MKKIIFLILLACTTGNAQKELWGVNSTQSYIDYSNPANPVTIPYYGNISKYDINGQNPEIVYEFDGVTGKLPKGKLFLASNGKLYGTTRNGGLIGSVGSPNEDGFGVLYEYDLILNKYKVIHDFDLLSGGYPSIGVIEPTAGKLYGAYGRKLFSFDIGLEQFSEFGNSNFYTINNELMKASDGFLYCTTMGIPGNCPSAVVNSPTYGSIMKINTSNNTYQRVYEFKCNATDGVNINTTTGTLIEHQPGKLTGQVTAGFDFANTSNGLLYDFNINTNNFTKKIDFDGFNLGNYPNCLVNSNGDKIYGVCKSGGSVVVPPSTTSDQAGTIFEYTPTTNTIVKLHTFNETTGLHPKSIIKATTGDYFGISNGGVFKFNPTDNSVIMPTPVLTLTPLNAGVSESLIEICRKPSYQEIVVDTFDACVGGTFNYDVQNTNATTYQWKKNNQEVVGQTTGILNLTNVQASDAGNYTCLMTNECGTTTTMPLILTVSCLGLNTVATLNKAVKLYPNPAKEWLNIELPSNIEITITNCTVTNLLGQTSPHDISGNRINVSHLQQGIYIISLETNYGKWNGKFIKE